MSDGINLADVAEKLVAEPLAPARPFDQAGNIDKLHGCRQDILRLDDRRQRIETIVRHGNDADIRLNGTERIVGRFSSGRSDRVEDGRLADVRQADDSAFESHSV